MRALASLGIIFTIALSLLNVKNVGYIQEPNSLEKYAVKTVEIEQVPYSDPVWP
jgi:hypothetical protein